MPPKPRPSSAPTGPNGPEVRPAAQGEATGRKTPKATRPAPTPDTPPDIRPKARKTAPKAAPTLPPKTTSKAAAKAAAATSKAVAKAGKPAAQRAPRDMKPAELRTFLLDLARAWPDAKTELVYTTPFTLLVAVVLSAQATDASVNRVTPALFAAAPTPAAMVALGEDAVAQLIRTIGLWRSKAHNVVELSRQLLAEHDGAVPGTREALEKLAGVGRKTANVVLSVAFDQPTVPVDTHVFRLANRSGLGRGRTVEAVEKALERRIPQEMKQESHHWMILQGRYVCKARKPECWRCAAQDPCLYPDKTPLPTPARRQPAAP